MRTKVSVIATAIVLLVGLLGTTANAGRFYGHRGNRSMISVSQANSIALDRFPRGVLVGSARLVTDMGRDAYRVGVRTGNVRHIVFVAAHSGRILEVRDRPARGRVFRYQR